MIKQIIDNFLFFLHSFSRLHKKKTSSAACIVFSKDRPLQLHLFLETFQANLVGRSSLFVLYAASTPIFESGYSVLMQRFENVIFIREEVFSRDLRELILSINEENIIFFVDDIVFTRKFSIAQYAMLCNYMTIPSLRLGLNIKKSYQSNLNLPYPIFLIKSKFFIRWLYLFGKNDWGYPFSVDGNVYKKDSLVYMMKKIKFSSPNSFENNMQYFRFTLKLMVGVAFTRSVLFNNPLNLVQSEYLNKSEDLNVIDLAKIYLNAGIINSKSFVDLENTSVHQNVEFEIIKNP